jgi:hypothetical protein
MSLADVDVHIMAFLELMLVLLNEACVPATNTLLRISFD